MLNQSGAGNEGGERSRTRTVVGAPEVPLYQSDCHRVVGERSAVDVDVLGGQLSVGAEE